MQNADAPPPIFPPLEPRAGDAPVPPAARRAGWPVGVAWGVILLILVVTFLSQHAAKKPDATAPADRKAAEAVLQVMTELQARYLYGASIVLGSMGDQQSSALLLTNARTFFGQGTVGQRIRYAILAAEFSGPEEGISEISRLWADIEEETANRRGDELPFALDRGDEEVIRDLALLFRDKVDDGGRAERQRAPNEVEEARTRLRRALGWFGAMAVMVSDPDDAETARYVRSRAVRTFAVALTAFGGLGLFFCAGIVLLIIMMLRVLAVRVRPMVRPPGCAPGGIYAETFACWLVLFLLFLGPGAAALMAMGLPRRPAITILFFLSLLALGWPMLRGVTWAQVCRDIGLTRGKSVVREFGCGLLGYVMGIPLLVIGGAITLTLMAISARLAVRDETAVQTLFPFDAGPAHPIVGDFAGGGLMTYVQLLIIAVIAAPIVEEIMFRGVLYRHFRDACGGRLRALSIPLSVTGSAFIFAAVHPQGWMGIPVLMSLAIAFALAREWRGSLIAPIVMHAVSNGLVMTMLALMVID